MILGEPVKEGLPQVVQRLIKWREKNHLSQRAAVEVMQARDCDVSIFTLQSWERGHRQPGKFTEKVLRRFLKENPVIPNPPSYRPGPPKR
jgi:DNA-binding transcriptional regulator YiaG